jgi:Protein of unknown function (DUF2778)
MGRFIRHSVVAGLAALAVAASAPWQSKIPVIDAPGVLSPDATREPGGNPPLSKSAPRGRSRILAMHPRPDGRTAIYDIAAHAVYLPNGDTLEAHSGLDSSLDDPRYISLKNRGPTPPNVYTLTLRDQPFHGVRAIRLIPLDESKMFGRDGMLAHSYLRGPTGQSSGCVSFRDYPAFLNAFLRGEVERLVVVDHLPDRVSFISARLITRR